MAGTDAVALLIAVVFGRPWPPPGVPDTPRNRALREEIIAEVDALPPGVIPDVPAA